MLSNPTNNDPDESLPTSSQIVRNIYESFESNVYTVYGTSKFYTRIDGVDYNIDSIVRSNSNSSSKDKFIHYNNNDVYYSGDPNNSSGINDDSLINFNTYSIDSMGGTNFIHDNNTGRVNLGNYFGAKYDDFLNDDEAYPPAWCNRIICICVGAGGSGGAAGFGDNDGQGGGGAGSGAAICGYIDIGSNDSPLNIKIGKGGKKNTWEHANGNSGGNTEVSVNNKSIIAGGGGQGYAYNYPGGGGTTSSSSFNIIKSQNGAGGNWGYNANDDDDEMSDDKQNYRAPGGSSVYFLTNTGNNFGYGGWGGNFGNDDKFDGDYGGNGNDGFVRIYYTRV